MRWIGCLWFVLSTSALAGGAEAQTWHRVVGLLEYLEGDYTQALASHDAAELEEQKGLADEVVKQLEGAGADGAPYLPSALAIQSAIAKGAPALDVTHSCGALAQRVVQERHLDQTPKKTPSLVDGQVQFEQHCATCHGIKGDAQTEIAKTLTPPPANFHDEARMRTLTPYKIFNTTTFGIQGTAMTGFPALSDNVRWAQAFYVFTLRQPPCDHQPPEVTLGELATSTDDDLSTKYGARELACLRRTVPRPNADPLAVAQRGLDRSLELYAKGDLEGARQAVVDAYLDGLEPVEPALRARDSEMVTRMEGAFTRARLAAQSGGRFEAEVQEAKALLSQAQSGTTGSTFWTVFITALLILLREGFEAVVVVGALLAVLKKMEATREARVVHVAWVSALVVGALAFVFGQKFFAGANREWLETIVALLAVGFLLYAALWLNARSNMSKFMGELRGKMTAALGSGSTAGLFFISFTSVGRESIETALFLQGLASESRDGATFGAIAGLVALLGLVAVVRTVGFKLPMKTLFKASTVLLFATAVMLLGKGLHGLQELGLLPLMPVPFVTIAALGLFPDALSLGPQAILAAIPFAYTAWNRRRQG